jgi:hypothetical protein
MQDLEFYYTSFYDEADFFTLIRKIFFLLIFSLLVASMYIDDDNKINVYLITAGLLLLQVITVYLKYLKDKLYYAGITLQKYYLLFKLIPNALDKNNAVYLMSKASNRVLKRVNDKKSSSTCDYANDGSIPLEINDFVKQIHENSFLNSWYYKYHYDRSRLTAVLFFSLIFISFLAFLPLLNSDSQLFYPRLTITVLSLGLFYEFYEEISKTKRTYKMMQYIDNFLTSNKNVDYQTMLNLFSTYNEAKLITPDIPKSIYKHNRARVNILWEEKKVSLNY